MAPLQHTPWHLLPLTTPLRSVPPLLVQSTFTATSYTLYLTDLTSIWTETLSKREILARSEKEGTSIDPSEDLSQLKILLEKLQHAVLIPSEDVDAEITSTSDGTLRLKTITELQTPLRPLSWTFCLSLEPKVQYTNLFVLPLLGAVATLQDQTESLLQTIREKDMLIERLTDQLKEHSLDVKAMLGGGRTRRRGLEKFDEEVWRGDYVMEGERRVGEVVKEIFGGKGGMKEVGGGVRGLGMVEEWWRSVEDGGDDENKQEEVPMRKAVGRKVVEKTSVRDLKKAQAQTDDEDDGFKVRLMTFLPFLMFFHTISPVSQSSLTPLMSAWACEICENFRHTVYAKYLFEAYTSLQCIQFRMNKNISSKLILHMLWSQTLCPQNPRLRNPTSK